MELVFLVLPIILLCIFIWAQYRGLEYVLIHYRWVFVCFFLLPVSVLYDTFYYLRSHLIFALNTAPEKHHERVAYVQKQVKVLYLESN